MPHALHEVQFFLKVMFMIQQGCGKSGFVVANYERPIFSNQSLEPVAPSPLTIPEMADGF